MNKIYLLLILSLLTFCFSCHKIDYTIVEMLQFEKEVVNLDSKQQEVEVKANRCEWQMAIGDENGMRIEGDTLKGDWFILTKKNNGASLLINVNSNNGLERSLVVGFKSESTNTFTRILIKQMGIEE